MYQIKASDIRLLGEFRERPTQQRSLELKRLLNRLRMGPLAGRHVIVATVPYAEWAIVRLGEKRGDAVTLLSDARYRKLADAEWALLKIRWKEHSGFPWPADLD